MKKIIALTAFIVLTVSSAGALESAAVSGSGSKALSYVEFTSLPENNGAPYRVVQKRYEDYRQGRLPITTLNASEIR